MITGASSGIGAQAARHLARSHPEDRLILIGRNPDRTKRVAAEVGADYFFADYSRLADVRRLAAKLRETTDRIDVLANNAGGLFNGPSLTQDGFELTFQTNHLAPMLLTHELLPMLQQSRATVVATASMANLMARPDLTDLNGLREFHAFRNYANSKLANILFTQELFARFPELNPVAFHPGVVHTNFSLDTRSLAKYLYKIPLARFYTIDDTEGGKHLTYFITGTPGIMWEPGHYYDGTSRTPGRINKHATVPGLAARHFDLSSNLLGIDWQKN